MNAMTKQRPTALVVITNLPSVSEAGYRTFTALELGTNNVWSNVSKWETLPSGVVLNGGTNTAVRPASGLATLPNNTNTFRYKSANLAHSAYGYILFNPNGSLDTSTNAKLEFIIGTSVGGNITRTGPEGNWYRLIVNNATGRVKSARP